MGMRKLCFVILVAIVSSSVAFACETPKDILLEYLRRDFHGERLSHEVSAGIDNMQVDADFEPAWDVTTLTTGYEVRSFTQNGNKAIATVLFKNSWETTGNTKLDSAMIKDEIVEIHMMKIGEGWKVSPPFYPPHVNSNVLIEHIQKLVRDAKKGKVDKTYIDDMESELNSIHKYKKVFELR